MKSKSIDIEHTTPTKITSLERAIKLSKNIKDAVEQAAGELTSINAILKQYNKSSVPFQTIQKAIVQNECVEHKIAKAVDDLNQLNTQISKEMEERVVVESKLADTKTDLAEGVEERVVVESELADTKTDLAEVHDDLSKSQAKEREARKRAHQDPLTGIPNRASFEQALDHGLVQARRRSWGLAVLFIDIDKFKSINDSYGHDLGDKVLLMVANRLQSSLRQEDTASRWGGDEFVCLLLEVKLEADVSRFANKLVRRIAEACEFNGTVFSINISIGISIFPANGETADQLLKNADTAMFKAKGTKKRVVLFRESSP